MKDKEIASVPWYYQCSKLWLSHRTSTSVWEAKSWIWRGEISGNANRCFCTVKNSYNRSANCFLQNCKNSPVVCSFAPCLSPAPSIESCYVPPSFSFTFQKVEDIRAEDEWRHTHCHKPSISLLYNYIVILFIFRFLNSRCVFIIIGHYSTATVLRNPQTSINSSLGIHVSVVFKRGHRFCFRKNLSR